MKQADPDSGHHEDAPVAKRKPATRRGGSGGHPSGSPAAQAAGAPTFSGGQPEWFKADPSSSPVPPEPTADHRGNIPVPVQPAQPLQNAATTPAEPAQRCLGALSARAREAAQVRAMPALSEADAPR